MKINFNVIDGIAALLEPVNALVDNVTTSKEEKLEARNKMQALQNALMVKALEYESKMVEVKAKALMSETMGSWIQRSWRPILMLAFGFIVIYEYFLANVFGLPKSNLPIQFWDLLNLGIGGYIIGRSAEKIVPKMKFKNSKNKDNE